MARLKIFCVGEGSHVSESAAMWTWECLSFRYIAAVPDKLLMLSGVLCVWLRRCGGGH